jgi:hypothetical protein
MLPMVAVGATNGRWRCYQRPVEVLPAMAMVLQGEFDILPLRSGARGGKRCYHRQGDVLPRVSVGATTDEGWCCRGDDATTGDGDAASRIWLSFLWHRALLPPARAGATSQA